MKRVMSPLRYPGSKVRITEMIAGLLERNLLVGSHFYEPFAGGSAVSLSRLEPEIHKVYEDTMKALEAKQAEKSLSLAETLSRLQALHQLLDDLNIWPFNRHALAFVMSIYVIETLLTLHQIFNEVKSPF